ncbi:ankyrin repeat-containing domain protein [Aspergillus sergii]|uniref:Ankyrin repeat-containing domain protein n=1 Tax=Aspergillus sergii TaxID=1034303 RepID=A0A5N6WZ86_9EURO|nr:ankyrin repeat-containing domain protein [Aspergillus sergii]
MATRSCNPTTSSLSYAAQYGDETVIRLLLREGARIDHFDDDQRTPLSYAAEKGHEGIIKLLLENGAKPDSKDIRRRTPLIYAAEKGHETIVKLLLKKGAEPDSTDIDLRTPLSYAAEEGCECAIRLLRAHDAESDSMATRPRYATDPDPLVTEKRYRLDRLINGRRTALSYVAEEGHEAVIKLLIAHGADPNLKDVLGQTPLSYATQKAHEAMIARLPHFKYMALSSPTKFRLLRLSPGSEGPLECFIEDYELSSKLCPYYRALSYTWGASSRKSWILLNGASFPVTQNLYEAMQQLRKLGYHSSLWWIDLICINQSDKSERCQQVSMMRNIFGMAKEVVVWLGRDTPLGHNISHTITVPYWSRVWVIQEIMVAKEILLMSESGTTVWDQFVAHLDIFLEKEPDPDDIDLQRAAPYLASNCNRLVELWKKKAMQKLSLSTLVCFAGDSLATNPRDKIYGLLGLVNHGSGGDIVPDYGRSPCSVYCMAIKKMQDDTHQDLSLLHKQLNNLNHNPFDAGDGDSRNCEGIECGIWDFCKLFAFRTRARQW